MLLWTIINLMQILLNLKIKVGSKVSNIFIYQISSNIVQHFVILQMKMDDASPSLL